MLNNTQKSACLRIELAATVDWGEPFVKACYYLEGDGPLAGDCYEAIQAGLHTEFIPNARAIAQLLSGKPPNDQSHEALVTYARACVQPGLEYFQRQLATNLKASLDVIKGCRLFSPQKVQQPNASQSKKIRRYHF